MHGEEVLVLGEEVLVFGEEVLVFGEEVLVYGKCKACHGLHDDVLGNKTQ